MCSLFALIAEDDDDLNQDNNETMKLRREGLTLNLIILMN